MNATDELRRMLDERGVEHTDFGGMTEWANENRRICRAYTRPEPLTVDVAMLAVPPEQAIAATLGRRTCRDVYPQATYCFTCSECGHVRRFVQGWNNTTDSEQHEFRFCPNCGAKVVDG